MVYPGAKMIMDRRGATRLVVLVGPYALKVPVVGHGFKAFLTGVLASLNEKTWSGASKNTPRTVYCNCFGLILIARRCRHIRHRGLFYVALAEVVAKSDIHEDFWYSDCKPENFGYIGPDLIKLDARQ